MGRSPGVAVGGGMLLRAVCAAPGHARHRVRTPPKFWTDSLGKFLLLVALGAIVYFLLRNYKRAIARQQGDDRQAAPAARTSEDMVRCAHCGVHLPRSESYLSGGELYCSDEHRRLGPGAA